MAENLGEAQLRLTVDLDAFQDSLRRARALVSSELANVTAAPSASRGRSSAARTRRERQLQVREAQEAQRQIDRAARQGGAREGVRALEIAQERRFRLARRIDLLEGRGADVARLRANLGRLTDTQIRRQFGSFRQVSQELARQVTLEERRLQTQRRIERAARQQASVGAQMGGARESVFALERAQDRRFRISQRINRLEDQGVGVAQLRTKLGELTTSYGQRQFGTARQLSRELERQVALTEQRARRERDYQRALARSARIGGPSEPVRGRVDLAGSPRFLEAQQREAARLAREQAAAERTRRLEAARAAREQARLDRAAAAARQAEIREGLRIGRLNTSPVSGRTADGIALPGSPNARGRDFNLRSSWTKFLAQLQEVKRDIDAASVETSKRLRGPASPVSGRLINGRVIPGSPADIERQSREATVRGPALPVSGRLINGQVVPGSPADLARRSRVGSSNLADELLAAERSVGRLNTISEVLQRLGSPRQRKALGDGLSSVLIGGAFPALFGQGAGASVGGALGGALGVFGGGFGFAGSLIGTAIGQQADNLTALAGALDAPIARFGELQQAGVLSSRALEKNVEALINAGRYAEAEAKIREDLAKRGLDATTTTRLAQESDKLNRSLADLGVSIGLVVQGPIADLLNSFNDLLAPGRVAAQSRAIQDGLSPEDRQAYLARRRELISQGGQNILDINRQVNSEFGPRTQEALNAQKQITDAQREDNALLSAKYRLIDASTQGYERLTLEREKELLLEEKKAALRADPNNSLKVEQEAAERLYKINQQIARLDQKRFAENVAAANQIRSIQEDIAIQQRRGGLTSLGIGALGSVKAFEDAKRAEQDAQAALRADPSNNNLLNASQVAAENVRLAAAKTKADLIDAFKSAQDSVRAISRGIEDTVLQLQQLQNTSGGGLNEFMSAQQVSDRQAALAAELRPIAQEIANRRGLNFSLSGTNEDRNNAILRLIQADRQQTRLEQDLAQSRVDLGKAQNDLATINQSLVTVNTDLATATQALADKDWNVYVSVPGGSASGDVVREGVYQ